MNGAIYYAGFVAIRLSQATRSTYFANTVKTHPFCTDASKQSFFFFLFRTVSSTCPTTMFKFYKSIYDRPTLLATRLFSKFRYRLLFTKRDSSVSTVKLRTNTTDLSICLSIYLSKIENCRVPPLVDEN